MKKISNYFNFTRTCLLNGVGLLVCCAPSICREPTQFYNPGIGHYFENVGIYLFSASAIESPQLADELLRQKLADTDSNSENQLELKLRT